MAIYPSYPILAQHWKTKALCNFWLNSENLLAWLVLATTQFSFFEPGKAYGILNLILVISTGEESQYQIKCAILRTILTVFFIWSFNDEAKNQELLLPSTLTIKI